MQPVQLGFKLEAKLYLLLVRSNILVDFLLQLDPQLNLLIKALFKFAVLALHLVHAHFQFLLIDAHLAQLLIVASLSLFHGFLVLCANFFDQHVVIGAAAVFEENGVDFPDLGEQGVLVLRVLQRLVQHFVKADGVDEETSVDSIHHAHFDVLANQEESIDVGASDRLLLAWF